MQFIFNATIALIMLPFFLFAAALILVVCIFLVAVFTVHISVGGFLSIFLLCLLLLLLLFFLLSL